MQAIFTQQVLPPRSGAPLPFRVMDYKKEAGRRLRASRSDKKLTLADLSKAVRGVLSPSRISNYEQGTRMLGVEEALALAPILGVQAAFLLCVDKTEEGDLTKQEEELLRNFRALPENERGSYARRIGVLALAYKEPVADEKLNQNWQAPKRKRSAPQQ
jgi:transcriptional regulator with XRE-family HTH domain